MVDARLIERYAAAAWPATEIQEQDGWLLRYTPDVPRRRSNSALPLTPGEAPPAASLSLVEDFYAARGLPVTVQVTPAQEHAALDALLAERGYRYAAPTLVCVAPTDTVIGRSRPAAPLDVTIAAQPSRTWLDAYVDLDGHDNSQQAADQILSRIPGPAAYLSVEQDSCIAGMGLLVAAPGCAGVFCMATSPEYRRRGIAKAILHRGARWAAGQGADELYLQVMDDPEHHAARELYERRGFRLSHTYHYRIAPSF